MNRWKLSSRRGVRFLGAALFAAVISAALPAVAAAGATDDPGVSRAAEYLEEARQRASDLDVALDATAAQYEQANAHRIRMSDELAASDVALDQAAEAVAEAQDKLSSRIAAAYKHPREDLALTDALFSSPDAPSALHRAVLYRRLVASSADEVDRTRWATTLTETDVRQEQVVAAGAAASAKEWRRQSVVLANALVDAQAQVEEAESNLTEAQAAAERRAEAARRAEEQRRAQIAQVGTAPAGPLPSVRGRTCPVGTPNGFIDSWGFPRSGGRTHQGVDIFAAYGTPLFAVGDGHIYRVYNNPIGGLSINLIDEAGNMYYYTHLSSASVRTGQTVRMGQVIGAVGTSGNAAGTPPHLHWQFHPGNGAPVNPYPLAYALCR